MRNSFGDVGLEMHADIRRLLNAGQPGTLKVRRGAETMDIRFPGKLRARGSTPVRRPPGLAIADELVPSVTLENLFGRRWLVDDDGTQGNLTVVVWNDLQRVLRVGQSLSEDVSVLSGGVETPARFPFVEAHRE